MRKFLLILLLLIIFTPANAKEPEFKNIFITDISEAEEYLEPESITLKGYAQFLDDDNAIVYLQDDENQFVINLKKPQKITSDTLIDKNKNIHKQKPMIISRFGNEQYDFLSEGHSSSIKFGNLSAGTSYSNDIDRAQLNRKAGIFTKYDTKHFALKTAYEKSFGSAYGDYVDSIFLIPEIKINDIFSLKEVFSSNQTYKIKKAEFILSINPLAKTKNNKNRINIELGTVHVYDNSNNLLKNQIKINTNFKL